MGVCRNLYNVVPAFCLALGMLGVAVQDVDAAPNPNFHIYIAYGQSNMAGNGEIVPAEDQATDPKNFLMLASHSANARQRSGSTTQSIETGKWYPAIPPMFHPTENLSPADYFGRAMVDSLPGVTVGIIPVAIGAVAIKAFDKDQYQAYFNSAESYIKNWARDYDSNPYQRIVDLGKKAKEVGVIKGFIFHQGETDGSGTEWQNAVYKTYKDFITALDLDENEVAFVAGEMLQEGNNCCSSKNGGIAQLKSKFKKFGLASSKGLQGNGKDPYHFGRAGVIELGKRYCSEMLKLIDKTIDPDAPAVNLVDPTQSTVPDEPPEEYGPYGDAPATIPGTIEAENYNKGGADKGYYDLSKGNEGGKFRKNDVDLYQPNMGIVVGHCQKGEWLKYTVSVAADGEYEISALVAGENGTGSFKLYMDSVEIGTEIANDIDYVEFKAVSSGTDNLVTLRMENPVKESSFAIVDMQGRKLGVIQATNMAEAVEKTKKNVTQNMVSGGVYFVVSNTKSKHRTMQKVVIYEK